MHPYLNNTELLDWCKEKGIHVTAYGKYPCPQGCAERHRSHAFMCHVLRNSTGVLLVMPGRGRVPFRTFLGGPENMKFNKVRRHVLVRLPHDPICIRIRLLFRHCSAWWGCAGKLRLGNHQDFQNDGVLMFPSHAPKSMHPLLCSFLSPACSSIGQRQQRICVVSRGSGHMRDGPESGQKPGPGAMYKYSVQIVASMSSLQRSAVVV